MAMEEVVGEVVTEEEEEEGVVVVEAAAEEMVEDARKRFLGPKTLHDSMDQLLQTLKVNLLTSMITEIMHGFGDGERVILDGWQGILSLAAVGGFASGHFRE